ncbi:MAG TPA: chorismate mutase [Rhodothermales bacterium]
MPVRAFEDLLDRLRQAAPDIPDHPTEDDLTPWRERIDALDRAILQMLNQRAICANTIGRIKRKLGMPVYVPRREEEVLENVTNANAGPLANEAVKRLFERIIDETRSLERHLYERESGSDDEPTQG